MKARVDQFRKNRLFWPFLVFVILVLCEHILMREYSGDAVRVFSQVLDQRGILAASNYRYHVWTSRTLIEIPLFLLAHHMHWHLWMMLDVAVNVVIWITMVELTRIKNPWPLTALILVYPMVEMESAGWMATTINYMWPLAMMLVALVSLHRMYNKQHVGIIFALVALAAELFATNFETLIVMYGIILGIFSLTMLVSRRITKLGVFYTVMQWGVLLVNLAWVLACPGNWRRNGIEIATWMKDFGSLSVVDKFVLGVNTTALQLVSKNLIFVLFSVLLIAFAFTKAHGKLSFSVAIAAIPFVSVLAVQLAPTFFPYMARLIKQFSGTTRVNSTNYYSPGNFLIFVFGMIVITAMITEVFDLAPTLIDGIVVSGVLGSGMLTRIAMGFSPTLYASGDRTFLFLDFALIYCMIRMISWFNQAKPDIKIVRMGKAGLYSVAMIAIIGNLLSIATAN